MSINGRGKKKEEEKKAERQSENPISSLHLDLIH
jgi:hypothetical protein